MTAAGRTTAELAGGFQRALLLALGVTDLILWPKRWALGKAGGSFPGSRSRKRVAGMILLASLLTLNWSAGRRWVALGVTAAAVMFVIWLRNGGDSLKLHDYREYEWPFAWAYFAATLLGMTLLRNARLRWEMKRANARFPPQINLRSILILDQRRRLRTSRSPALSAARLAT